MFDNLRGMRLGEDVYISVLGHSLKYRVTGREVVGSTGYQEVCYEAGHYRITLITCTPYGPSTDRLLVTAERVHVDDQRTETLWRPSISWWMYLVFALIAIVFLFITTRNLLLRR